jgi:hypothetical protein
MTSGGPRAVCCNRQILSPVWRASSEQLSASAPAFARPWSGHTRDAEIPGRRPPPQVPGALGGQPRPGLRIKCRGREPGSRILPAVRRAPGSPAPQLPAPGASWAPGPARREGKARRGPRGGSGQPRGSRARRAGTAAGGKWRGARPTWSPSPTRRRRRLLLGSTESSQPATAAHRKPRCHRLARGRQGAAGTPWPRAPGAVRARRGRGRGR